MKRSYLKGYDVMLSESAIIQYTVMYHMTNGEHDLTVLYDDLGREIARDKDAHTNETNALRSVLKRAYKNMENRYLLSQKSVYKALKEKLPEVSVLREQFKKTADGRELLGIIAGVNDVTSR